MGSVPRPNGSSAGRSGRIAEEKTTRSSSYWNLSRTRGWSICQISELQGHDAHILVTCEITTPEKPGRTESRRLALDRGTFRPQQRRPTHYPQWLPPPISLRSPTGSNELPMHGPCGRRESSGPTHRIGSGSPGVVSFSAWRAVI